MGPIQTPIPEPVLSYHHLLVLKPEYYVNTIAADALGPCVARSSATMVWTMYNDNNDNSNGNGNSNSYSYSNSNNDNDNNNNNSNNNNNNNNNELILVFHEKIFKLPVLSMCLEMIERQDIFLLPKIHVDDKG